jgi:hypothetical protein
VLVAIRALRKMILFAFEDDLSYVSIFHSCDSSSIIAVVFNLQVCSRLIHTVAMTRNIFTGTPHRTYLCGFVKESCVDALFS